MYNKILKDLNSAVPLDLAPTKKLLGRLHQHIDYSIIKRDAKGLMVMQVALRDFLSANKSRFHKEMQENSNISYRIKRFLNELGILSEKVKKRLDDGF